MTHHDDHHDHAHDHHHDHAHEHHHDHAHDHHHDHAHAHAHPHAHQSEPTLTFEEKFIKLLEHWVKHDQDHARNYQDWAEKAQQQGMPEVAQLLREAADLSGTISAKFEQAAKLIKP